MCCKKSAKFLVSSSMYIASLLSHRKCFQRKVQLRSNASEWNMICFSCRWVGYRPADVQWGSGGRPNGKYLTCRGLTRRVWRVPIRCCATEMHSKHEDGRISVSRSSLLFATSVSHVSYSHLNSVEIVRVLMRYLRRGLTFWLLIGP